MLLEKLLLKGAVLPIDVGFASYFEDRFKILLSTLMLSSRQGHVCFNPVEFAYEAGDKALEEAWKKEVLSAFHSFSLQSLLPHVVEENGRLYLQKQWAHENKLTFHLKRILQFKLPPLSLSPPLALNPEQREAYSIALSHPLSILTGGPGTGKTFVVHHLVKAMPQGSTIFLAAPTGKAAARLKEMNPHITCTTLHALLGVRSPKDLHVEKRGYLKADLIVVDECSMIDIQLFSYLLSSLREGGRLVLIGDPYQLPPVEAGSIFADLINMVPTASLSLCMRSDRKPLLDLAEAVKNGRKWDFPLSSLDEVEKLWGRAYPAPSFERPAVSSVISSFRVLSTIREGPLGVHHINESIAKKTISSLKPGQFLQVPIILRQTDADLGLYNGEMGLLVRDYQKPLYALFGNQEISTSLLPRYDLAYCLSVHQAQGSEFDEVILCAPPGSEVFGRELLYTGITRARKDVKIVGSIETLNKTIAREGRKISQLRAKVKI